MKVNKFNEAHNEEIIIKKMNQIRYTIYGVYFYTYKQKKYSVRK